MNNNNLTFYLKAELVDKKTGATKHIDHFEIEGPYGAAAVANFEHALHVEGKYYMSDSYSYNQVPNQN